MVDERKNEGNPFTAAGGLASELIAQGAEIMLAEHDQMRKFAVMRRRDPKECLNVALAELAAFPEEAEKAYYRLPRRSKNCNHEAKTTCKSCNWIEGASVGTARVVARNWGNCTVGVRVAAETNDYWDLEGRFLDFESNFSGTRGLRVLKRVKWGGKVKHVSEMSPQEELQIFQSGISKCFRNVVRDGIPEAIIDRYWQTAKQMIAGTTPTKKLSKKAVAKILDAFNPMRVSPEMLEEKLGKTMDKWTGDDAAALKGILNALEAKEITLAMVFGGDVQEPEPEPMDETDEVPFEETDPGAPVEADVVEPQPVDETEKGLFK